MASAAEGHGLRAVGGVGVFEHVVPAVSHVERYARRVSLLELGREEAVADVAHDLLR